jgi:hypothetical protein
MSWAEASHSTSNMITTLEYAFRCHILYLSKDPRSGTKWVEEPGFMVEGVYVSPTTQGS